MDKYIAQGYACDVRYVKQTLWLVCQLEYLYQYLLFPIVYTRRASVIIYRSLIRSFYFVQDSCELSSATEHKYG